MGRRSIIPSSLIRKISSAINSERKLQYQNNLINSQHGDCKELPPKYSIQSVEFNEATRVAKLEILQTQNYRTINKYITQNYVKYPIYSPWKTRYKTIKKSIKLTNVALEDLQNHDDDIIALLAEDIILQINIEDLFPSWFLKLYLTRAHTLELENLLAEEANLISIKKSEISTCKSKIGELSKTKNEEQKLLIANNKLISSTQKRYNKACSYEKNVFKSIITFGIYALIRSKKRKLRLENNLEKQKANSSAYTNKVEALTKEISELNDNISTFEKNIVEIHLSFEKETTEKTAIYNQKLASICELPVFLRTDKNFIKLKNLVGIEYEKIIGVYVIHNIEKDKYYVGQSKDVMKRIKQHFIGTTPKNVIFAEDYYTSQFENKENLFEVKIIRCETKDELDRLEKKLIADYDSWNSGYNGTQGNT